MSVLLIPSAFFKSILNFCFYVLFWLSLCCCLGFSLVAEQGLVEAWGLLTAVASLVGEYQL